MAKKRQRTPRANVYWKDVPKSACIEDRGHLFVARFANGQRAVVVWSSFDSAHAQRSLLARSRKGCKVK